MDEYILSVIQERSVIGLYSSFHHYNHLFCRKEDGTLYPTNRWKTPMSMFDTDATFKVFCGNHSTHTASGLIMKSDQEMSKHLFDYGMSDKYCNYDTFCVTLI